MPRVLSGQSLASLMAQETGEAYLVLLTVSDSSGVIARLTSDSVDTVVGADTYQQFPFDITLPDNAEGKVSTAQLSFSNIDRRFIQSIREETMPLGVNIKVVMGSDPTDILAEFTDFLLRNVTYNVTTISGTLTLESFLSEQVGQIMNGQTFPGLFFT